MATKHDGARNIVYADSEADVRAMNGEEYETGCVVIVCETNGKIYIVNCQHQIVEV